MEFKMGNFYQCSFERENSHTVAWIPERGAKVGAVVEFKDGDKRDAGWKVVRVGGRMDEKQLHDFNSMNRSHRQGSDV
jgi:hypothetical protein